MSWAALPTALATARRDEPLARHTSMRVGGPADFFAQVETTQALAALLRDCHGYGIPTFYLGGGTNLIVADRGIRGVAIKLGRAFAAANWDSQPEYTAVRVGAAMNLKRLVVESVERGLSGLEFGEGIPGTSGGGVLMNAGAFGGELGDVVTAVCGVDRTGELLRLEREELGFYYRRLDLPVGFYVTELELRLVPAPREVIQAKVESARTKRGKKQPLGYPNAGSIFKNPPGDFAGRLLEQAQLKGRQVGEAQISPQHANFIINLGGAKAADVLALMRIMRDTVWERRGVWLEREVKLVGEW